MSPRVTLSATLPVAAVAAALLLAASHLALSRDHGAVTAAIPAAPVAVPAAMSASLAPMAPAPQSLDAGSWSDPPARTERAEVRTSPAAQVAAAPAFPAAEPAPAAPRKARNARAEKRHLAAHRPRREPARRPGLDPQGGTVVAALEPAPRTRTGGPLGDILRGLGLEEDPGRSR